MFTHTVIAFFNSIVFWYFCDMTGQGHSQGFTIHSIFVLVIMMIMIMVIMAMMMMMKMKIIMMTMMMTMKLWMELEA